MVSLQYTLAPVLKFFTGQHMRHSMFVIHWLFPPQPEKSAQPMWNQDVTGVPAMCSSWLAFNIINCSNTIQYNNFTFIFLCSLNINAYLLFTVHSVVRSRASRMHVYTRVPFDLADLMYNLFLWGIHKYCGSSAVSHHRTPGLGRGLMGSKKSFIFAEYLSLTTLTRRQGRD